MLDKIKSIGKGFLQSKQDELSLIAKKPIKSGRRVLLNTVVNRWLDKKPKYKTTERKLTNVLQDLDDLHNYGNTKLSRRAFLDNAIKRGVSREITPKAMERIRPNSKPNYDPMKKFSDVLDNTPDFIELDRRKALRKQKTSEYSYMVDVLI